MSLADAFAPILAHQFAQVQHDTFGHLDAKPGAYSGHIMFALGCHGDIVLLNWEFEGVTSNPWIYQELQGFIGAHIDKTDRPWGVWRFEGVYKRLKNGKVKFIGKVRPCRVTYRFSNRTRSA